MRLTRSENALKPALNETLLSEQVRMRLFDYAKLGGAANTAVNYAGFLPSCASKPNDDDKNTQPCLDAGWGGQSLLAASG